MKSGALDALIDEMRRSAHDTHLILRLVEYWMEKAFVAGKQVAFSAARHECGEYIRNHPIFTKEGAAGISIEEAIVAREKRDRL